jgi:hypothetical protein
VSDYGWLQQSSPRHASRASLTTNHTIPNDVTASTHQASINRCASSPMTTTSDSHPQVMLSMASARIARLPSEVATSSFRLARTYMMGIARVATIKPGRENSPPRRIQRLHVAPSTIYAASAYKRPPPIRSVARSVSFENSSLSFAKTSTQMSSVAIATVPSQSPDDHDRFGGTALTGLRPLARTSAALDVHREGDDVTSGCASFVTMAQTADFREGDHATFFWRLDAAWRRRVFGQGEMGP